MWGPRHVADPPPQLDVLAELPTDGIHRSSTFRASLEKAVDDINDKYGHSAPTCLPSSQMCGSSDDDQETSREHYGRINFQPRYRLPTLVQAPPLCSQPAASELKQVPPRSSSHGRRLGRARDGSPFPGRRGLDSLDHSPMPTNYSAEALIGEQAHCYEKSDYSLSKASARSRLSSSSSSATPEKICSGANENAAPQLRRVARRLEDHDAASADTTSPTLGAVDIVPGALPQDLDGGVSDPDRNNGNSCGSPPEHVPPRVEVLLPAAAVALKRVHSTRESFEACSEAEAATLHRPKPCGDKRTATVSQQRAPSVSELVSKFRRMESPDSNLVRAGIAGNANLHAPSPKTAAFGTCRSRFSDDSEDTSALASNADDADPHPALDMLGQECIVAST